MAPIVVRLARCGCAFATLLGLVSGACRLTSRTHPSIPRYVVSTRPIDIGLGAGFCIAVDPADRQGVWWWEPGGSGCASRSTGPDVFKAEHASVSRPAKSGPIAISFRVGTHSITRPFVDVRLVLESGELRVVESGARVPTERRNDLDVPGWR